ncbi:MBL fold metallo-hydrolase [Streptacidiphilus monticola]
MDAVLISHDHYDHLDMHTTRELARLQPSLLFVVPLGVGAHLERWGVPETRIVELDWDEKAEVGSLTLTATSAHHFSGRGFRRDGTLWASWVIAGPTQRVFYSGDTGYFDGFARTGEQYGPFDLTLVQIGAYSEHWADIHMTPEEGAHPPRRPRRAAGPGALGHVRAGHARLVGAGGAAVRGGGRAGRAGGGAAPRRAGGRGHSAQAGPLVAAHHLSPRQQAGTPGR